MSFEPITLKYQDRIENISMSIDFLGLVDFNCLQYFIEEILLQIN